MTRAILTLLALLLALTLWYTADPHRRATLHATATRILHPDPPPDPTPPTPPGTPYTHTLATPPAPTYQLRTTPDPTPTATLDRAGLHHSPELTQAATELATFYATHHRLAPSDALTFMLDAAGAPYWGVRQTVIVTTAPAEAPLFTALAQQTDTPGPWHAGLAQLTLPGNPPRLIRTALLARPAMTLDPIPRALTPGQTIPITGHLDPDHTHPALIARPPRGDLIDLPLTTRGPTFTTTLTPDTPGEWHLEILATGPAGPIPLAQLTLHVDQPLPRHYTATFPRTDHSTDPTTHLETLINTTRATHHQPPLTRDPALDAIAAAHATEMRNRTQVAHRSPTTGTLTDRLRSARIRTLASAENVALNPNIEDAHAGLMRSLGHRRNILSPTYTHLGLGAARGEAGWYITQIFTHPAPDLTDPHQAETALLDRIHQARRTAAAPPLTPDPHLTHLARLEAQTPDPSPHRAVERARATRRTGHLAAWTATLHHPQNLALPDDLLDPTHRHIGLAIHQHPDRPPPDVQVVILTADRPK